MADPTGSRTSSRCHAPPTSRPPAPHGSSVTTCVGPLVPAAVLADAVLLASELVSNGVLHAGLDERDTLRIRVRLSDATLRLEVENRGASGDVSARPPDAEVPNGFRARPGGDDQHALGHLRETDTNVWVGSPGPLGVEAEPEAVQVRSHSAAAALARSAAASRLRVSWITAVRSGSGGNGTGRRRT